MPLPITIRVTRNTLTPAVRAAAARFSSPRLGAIAGKEVALAIRRHLFTLNGARPNQLGGRRTNFYQRAGQSTNFAATAQGALVYVSLLGFRQRYYGGRIEAAPGKALAIPVAAEAHGKTPREFHDLSVIHWLGSDGRLKAGLARNEQTPLRLRRDRSGRPYYARAKSRGGEILFIFKKFVNQAGDPTVLPALDQLGDAARAAIADFVGGAQPDPAGN